MEETLLQWLNKCAPILAKYDAHEIAHFALMNQFDSGEVFELVPIWTRDRDTRTSYRIRMEFYIGHEIKFMEARGGKPDLGESWLALWEHIELGKDFGDHEDSYEYDQVA